MFVDGGGWRRPSEPSGSPRRPSSTKRQEIALWWLVLATLLVTLGGLIGGETIVQAITAFSGG